MAYDLSRLSDEELDELERRASTGRPRPDPYVVPPDPKRVAQQQAEEARRRAAEARAWAGEGRANEDQGMQRQRLGMDQDAAAMASAIKAMQLKQAQAEVESKDPYNRQVLQSVENDAMEKLRTIDRIRQNDRGATFPTLGFGAETMKDIGGSGAANIEADIGTLQAGSALSKIMEMTQQTGKNPFTPMSNQDVQLIANNTGNLSQKQDATNFHANLDNYAGAYKRAYAGAVGKRTLDEEIARRELTPEQARRARADYERRMSTPRKSGGGKTWYGLPKDAPRKSRVVNFSDLPE